MNKPVLVVMAAGMGSRYGGMKQIDPVGPKGQVIVDYSLYDARRAGFETVIFVIKHEIEDAFKAAIGDRVSKAMNVKYAFQQLDELPAGFAVPEGRVKPWGPATPFWRQRTSSTARLQSSMPMIITARRPSG
jgi:CTP:molybdopterin cytidylyltransferase MocA